MDIHVSFVDGFQGGESRGCACIIIVIFIFHVLFLAQDLEGKLEVKISGGCFHQTVDLEYVAMMVTCKKLV
jgi:hypothetical protein